ncbi:unnamed protein product [Hydatigera taeniaeformis]|uniref:Uncharacterized protein n=1 Tax=Hydatigena taeniaeformis TaxID=6205 RepID=A0A0R3XC48_HYDTA|nr:unnamed protein product [Hydatigera taeniaeformis]
MAYRKLLHLSDHGDVRLSQRPSRRVSGSHDINSMQTRNGPRTLTHVAIRLILALEAVTKEALLSMLLAHIVALPPHIR